MSADNMNIQRGGTGRLNAFRATAPLPSLESVVSQAGTNRQDTDSLAIANNQQTKQYNFSDKTNQALSSLSTGVQRLVTTNRIAEAMPDRIKERQVIENLKSEITKMVPGGVGFEEAGGTWKVPELVSLYQTVNRLPAADRMALADTTFRRAGTLAADDAGYAEATKKQFGTAIGAAAVGGTTSVETKTVSGTAGMDITQSTEKGFLDRLITSFEEYKEKVMQWLGFKSTPVHASSQTTENVITLTNSGALVSDKVFAHEVGHQLQMNEGRWDNEKIKEFAKLSGWTETYADGKSSAADGIDNETGRELLFNERVKPQREDNFVTKYAMTSPTEDFAESYAAFVMTPETLMERSPEKFLLINANSRQYSSEQVQSYAKEKGIDLNAVATKLVLESGLKQDTLDKICQVNQVSADKTAVLKDSQSSTSTDALGEVTKRITQATLSGDQAFVQGMLSNPQAVLGESWNSLSADEQSMLKDSSFVQKMVDNLQLGQASSASLTGQIDLAIAQDGVKSLVLKMVSSDGQSFREALASDPQKALKDAGIWDKLPDEMRAPLVLSSNREALTSMLAKIETLTSDATAEKNIENFVQKLTPESFAAFAQQLGDKDFPQRGAENIASIMTSGVALNESAGMPPMC